MSAIVLSAEWQIGGGPSEPTIVRFTTALERAGAEMLKVGEHILPLLLPILEVESGKQFDAQGAGPQSGSWAPLSTTYAKWKAAHFPGKPILERSGVMRSALTGPGPNSRREVSGNELAFGTLSVPYASYHQTGADLPKGVLPARPVFDFGPDFEKAMQAAAAAGVREALKVGSDGLLDFEDATFEGLPVLTGKRGGRFVVGSNGSKTYLKRAADGRVVQRRFGR